MVSNLPSIADENNVIPAAAISEAVVVHDPSCDVWGGRSCTCDARVLLGRPVTPPAGWTLWFRRARKEKWTAVASAKSEAEATELIGVGGRRHGGWLVCKVGQNPNGDRRAR